MRTKLLHPLGERRRAREHASGRAARTAGPALRSSDPAGERVREAGGPGDQATYTCGCGYLFHACVSTTVICPHCGADQAW